MLNRKAFAEIVTRATALPLTLEEGKKHLEIATTDTAHDDHISALISDARDQWEHDTDSATTNQTWRIKTDCIEDGYRLPKTPIVSITSITYYDVSNALQTLATSVYELDTSRQEIRLKYGQTWPGVSSRWDAYTVTYVCGYGTDGRYIPGVAKRAMLLLVGHHFENRDMLANEMIYSRKIYDDLVARYIRSSYP
jgi:uncharacterized phiE125 gp8 family phage protein